ncbi:hypothetical protein [Arenimonas sp.]|uniref:hypothetical protein n=1 Tax=Arenimonas sp. TaxID=1872635 RepID=UPI0039E44209
MNSKMLTCVALTVVSLTGCDAFVQAFGTGEQKKPEQKATVVVPVGPDQPHKVATPEARPASAAKLPQNEGELVPFGPAPARPTGEIQTNTCAFTGLNLPTQFKVYAAGAYSGRKLDFQIDDSGHEATQMDIAVNEDAMPVVLMLGAYEPTVWNIGWSPRTKILAVFASGYHRQAVAGLSPSVPVINSSYDNKGPCGYFYLSEENLGQLNPISRRLFGQPVARAYLVRNGSASLGEGTASGYVTNNSRPPESFRDRAAPLAGEAGLRDAVAKGLLREARSSDLDAWKAAYDTANRRDMPPLSGAAPRSSGSRDFLMHNAYVVIKAMQIPAGLYGAHSATFIVPRGVPRPTGDPGHSRILDYNTMTCAGSICGH